MSVVEALDAMVRIWSAYRMGYLTESDIDAIETIKEAAMKGMEKDESDND